MSKLPNWLTIIRILFVPVIVVIYYIGFEGWNYWAAGLFITACVTDIFDGMIARKYACVSNFGKLMDPMADKLLMLTLVLILDWGRIEAWVVIVIFAREFIISAFRLLAAEKGVVIAAGWTGKIKTLVQDIGVGLILLEDPVFSMWDIPAGAIFLYISVVLSAWSCIEYIWKNRQVLKEL